MKTKNLLLIIISVLFFMSTFIVSAQNNNKEVVKIKTSSQCGMCKERLETVLAYEKGIIKSDLDTATKVITVTYKPSKTTPEKIREVISKTGYDADNVPADKEAYSKLPACCKVPGKP